MKNLKIAKNSKNDIKFAFFMQKYSKKSQNLHKNIREKLLTISLITFLMLLIVGCGGGGTKFDGDGGLSGNYKDNHSLDFMSDANIPFDTSKPSIDEGYIIKQESKRATPSNCINYVADPTMLTIKKTLPYQEKESKKVAQIMYDLDLKYKDKWQLLADYYKGNVDCGGDYNEQVSRQVGYIINFVRSYPNLYKEYAKAYKINWSEDKPQLIYAVLFMQGTDERNDGVPDVRQAWYDLEQNLNSITPGKLAHPILYYSKELEEISMIHSHGLDLFSEPGVNLHATQNATIEGGKVGESAGDRVMRYLDAHYPNFPRSMSGENAYKDGFFNDNKDTLGAIRLAAMDIVFTYMIDPHQGVDPKTGRVWRGHAIGGVLGDHCSFGSGVYYISAQERGVHLNSPTPVGPHQISSTIDFFSTCP